MTRLVGLLMLMLALVPGAGADARSLQVPNEISSFFSALKWFKVNAGRYPTEEEGLLALVERPSNYPDGKRWQRMMDHVPLDPWERPYQYRVSAELTEPHSQSSVGIGIYSFGEDGISNSLGNDSDDINSWTDYYHQSFGERLLEQLEELPTGVWATLAALVAVIWGFVAAIRSSQKRA